MKKLINRLVLEYSKFLDVLDTDDNEVLLYHDIISNRIYKPTENSELKELVKNLLDAHYKNLNCIDVSKVTDFSNVFNKLDLSDVDISEWDVRQGKNF